MSSYLYRKGYRPNRDESFFGDVDAMPDISKNKETFMRWMFWWPFNAVFTFFSDPFRWFFESLYEFGHRSLQRIAESAFKDTITR